MTKVYLLKNQNSKDTYKSKLSQNYTPIFLPLLTHTLQTDKLCYFLNTNRFDILIITSQRAVECIQQCLEQLSEDLKSQILNKPVYTIGPATFQYLSSMGFHNVQGKESGNGHILSELIIQQTTNEKIVYLTGEIRKDIIPDALTNNNKNWQEVSVYRTIEIDNETDQFQTNLNHLNQGTNSDWVVFFSSQGTSPLLNKVERFKTAVIGPTTNEYLLENGVTVDVICEKPSADSLLRQIREFDESV